MTLYKKIYLIACVFAINSCSTTTSPSGTSPTGGTLTGNTSVDVNKIYNIVFYSDRDGNKEIYSMKSDGTETKRLTNNIEDDFAPQMSPDGKKIVYMKKKSDKFEINISGIDGSEQKKLLDSPDSNLFPKWSPDGKKIAFYSNIANNYFLYTINDDGTGKKEIAKDIPGIPNFSWSPDSNKLVFSKSDTLYISDLNDKTDTLPNQDISCFSPAWSPDGKKIAFVGLQDTKYNIYTIDADTKKINKISDVNQAITPAWSPDSKKITFLTKSANDVSAIIEIMISDADGKNQKNLTKGNDDGDISWFPNGSRIIFKSFRSDKFNLFSITPDGKDEKKLTDKGNNSWTSIGVTL